MITRNIVSRTSSQIALEDIVFHELFGRVWTNGGYTIKSKQDLSWAILYKDFFLQCLADYVNEGYVKVSARRKFLTHESVKDWMNQESPFNDPDQRRALQSRVLDTVNKFENKRHRADQTMFFKRKLKKIKDKILASDPFSFDKCCNILGLNEKVARLYFYSYRNLKLKYGDNIRIVTYTGNKKGLNIPSFSDIIEAEEANGEHDLTLFLHIGVKRELRNRALVRSKSERSN